MKATSFAYTNAALATCCAAALATAACASEAQTEPTAFTATQATPDDTYLDAPQTPGTWIYSSEPGETFALFGANMRQPDFMVRCGDGALALARVTHADQTEARAMKVITETVTSHLEAAPVPSMERILAASLDPRDPLLDAMAITKGRFAIEVEGFEPLYLPAWTEVSRVIEDCR